MTLLVGPAVAGITNVLTICVAYFVTRRESMCGDHPECCRRDDIVVLTSAARRVWSPFGSALAGLLFVDYLTRGLMGYAFATVGALVASTTAQVRGASDVFECVVCLVSSIFLQWISIVLCIATCVCAPVETDCNVVVNAPELSKNSGYTAARNPILATGNCDTLEGCPNPFNRLIYLVPEKNTASLGVHAPIELNR